MLNRWSAVDAPDRSDPVAQLVYASRLLGADTDLVLHGGGNTSVKTTVTDLTGESVEVLHVKGSGSDLATMGASGFTALRLARLRALLRLERLRDSEMMNELRCARLDATAPDPSVESLLHALLPHPAVLHSHADALLTLTNQPEGRRLVEEVYGDRVVVVPYVMPGFDLARLCAELFPAQSHPGTVGMVLLNHGLFTFGADAEEAYRRHIELVGLAEERLSRPAARVAAPAGPVSVDRVRLARLRQEISEVAGAPMVLSRYDDPTVRAFLDRPDLAAIATRGPVTPDHVLRTKRVPLVGTDVAGYAKEYQQYVDEHRERARTTLTVLDPAPRVLLDPELGLLTAGRRAADARIAQDIYRHTIDVIEAAEAIGGYQALPAGDIFDVEYWELEQAKLRRGGPAPEFTGEVAVVTGAASGIGRACAAALQARGACVVALDRDPSVTEPGGLARLGLQVDVTDRAAMDAALDTAVDHFGGVDIVVAAAGIFPASQEIAGLDPEAWQRTMAVNAESVAHLFARTHPLLALAPRGGRVVVVASRNAVAPGPGAVSYSASKAAVVQVARVAALEWASDGIRVNVVHPDAVFDTGLWSPEVLEGRARHYGLTVAEYKRRNLLGTEITSARVADLTAALCGDAFAATTGAQVPVDGGNERVI
ncbi:Rhamnose utilisation protein RhaD, predicted bifunctional aldolase and dehydrogenase [Micromonospora pallida]|uniref:Rhamnose utilisation protein RhaD, predicted bifunctional aldolase and dehydrogenase n=1 Tax=Micromonospora pallida TaxID=145854 RepID=A0A1C6SEP3_9ACTN|nr:bifunctional aldolase/short-chain dehydrogenase [Micromonospora pallida]SCL27955.1 Rhamnose utilisation protein RhaD, predicted bifunctional aldolase and dehydrogenase [Micromonospora pallida]